MRRWWPLLLACTFASPAAGQTLLEHYTANYTDDTFVLTREQALAGEPVHSMILDENGTIYLDFPVSSLTAPDPTKVCGEEHFIIHALPDGNISQTQIASAVVQVWPVAAGRIAGLREGDRVRIHSPTLTNSIQR